LFKAKRSFKGIRMMSNPRMAIKSPTISNGLNDASNLSASTIVKRIRLVNTKTPVEVSFPSY
jgi:hypothetical protein